MKRSIAIGQIILKFVVLSTLIIIILISIGWAGMNSFHTGFKSGDAVYLERESYGSSNVDLRDTVNLSIQCVSNESGRVCSNGSVSSNICIGNIASGVVSQALLSFNISQIPADAVIKRVSIDLRSCNPVGDPFLTLDCLRAYPAFYSSLSADSYFSGMPSGDLLKICSMTDLRNAQKNYPEMANAIQNSLGSPRFQVRMQFDDLESVYEGMLNFGQQGKGWSTEKTEALGEASGEWTPCLPKDTASTGSSGKSKSEKTNICFDTIKMTVTYLP